MAGGTRAVPRAHRRHRLRPRRLEQVFSDDIVAGEVRNSDIGTDAISTGKIIDSQVKSADIAGGAVDSSKIANGQVGSVDVLNDNLTGRDVAPNSLRGADIDESTLNVGDIPACQGNHASDAMVSAGSVCIDRYEASVWSSPTGGTQYGVSSDDYPCNDDGQNCDNIYARSVPGVIPSRFITYFQAQQALANSGKRLATNAEWQQAVAGTPDPGGSPGAEDCNSSSVGAVPTGSRDNCVSTYGANDMVGNLWELVGDWDEEGEQLGSCPNWSANFGSDVACLGRASGEASTRFPGVLERGGAFGDGAGAGPFAVASNAPPSISHLAIGFRGAH